MTLVMSKVAGPQSQLHSFEPAPHSCLRLRTNVEANNLTNVTVHELALSDQEGPCQMVVPKGQDGMARMDDRSEMMGGFQVPATTFDAWAEGRQLGRISVCKIDVEGHEPGVIRGMRKTLESGLIDAIVFEDHHLPQHSLAQAALRSYGFEILRIFKSPLRIHYRRINDAGPGRATNVRLRRVLEPPKQPHGISSSRARQPPAECPVGHAGHPSPLRTRNGSTSGSPRSASVSPGRSLTACCFASRRSTNDTARGVRTAAEVRGRHDGLPCRGTARNQLSGLTAPAGAG